MAVNKADRRDARTGAPAITKLGLTWFGSLALLWISAAVVSTFTKAIYLARPTDFVDVFEVFATASVLLITPVVVLTQFRMETWRKAVLAVAGSPLAAAAMYSFVSATGEALRDVMLLKDDTPRAEALFPIKKVTWTAKDPDRRRGNLPRLFLAENYPTLPMRLSAYRKLERQFQSQPDVAHQITIQGEWCLLLDIRYTDDFARTELPFGRGITDDMLIKCEAPNMSSVAINPSNDGKLIVPVLRLDSKRPR